MIWLIKEAQEFIGLITGEVEATGYLVGLYGSVLVNGEGKDLDLMLVPMRPAALRYDPDYVMEKLAKRFNGSLSAPYQSIHGSKAWCLSLPDGRIVDFSFRFESDELSRQRYYSAAM